jgi:ABC-2 type transport system permease protein
VSTPARPPKAEGWRLFLRTVIGRSYPRLIGQNRDKRGVLLEIFLPLLGVSAYVFVYRAIGAPEEFVGFVILGAAMTAFWLNVLWAMANQFFWEKESGNLALYIISPASLMAILLGMALGGMATTTLRAAAILLVGSWLFDVRYAVSDFGLLMLVFMLGLIALYGMGMMLASVFLLVGREGWHLIGLAQEPVYLVSGLYFPVKSLNAWVAMAASLLPLTLALDAMRQLTSTSGAAAGLLDVRIECLLLGILAAVFLLLAYMMLAYMERLAIAEGRLTESRG